MIVLNKAQVLLLHEHLNDVTGGTQGIRDEGLLESALAAPLQAFGDSMAYPTISEKAARLCFGLVKNHPFLDGNKRIGVHTMLVTLELNRITLSYTQEELSSVILSLAAGKIGYDGILKWIRNHTEGECA